MSTSPIIGFHHITMNVGGAQDDYDFHVKLLGLRLVKKTILFDGSRPVYHLYYGNERGEESTLLTTFPFRQDGRVAKPGSGQVKAVSLSVPDDSLGYWEHRFSSRNVAYRKIERLGSRRLVFKHPGGIEYELVGVPEDSRAPYTGSDVPAAAAVRGIYGTTISARDIGEMHEFMTDAMGFRVAGKEGGRTRYSIRDGAPGRIVEIAHDADLPQGTWRFGAGTVHHIAFHVDDAATQASFKAYLEGLGYTDCSEPKDRGYMMSVYFRTPSGTLFEAAYLYGGGFLKDEPVATLGTQICTPPWLLDRRDEFLAALEPIVDCAPDLRPPGQYQQRTVTAAT
jgi:glyoxalase family protein